MKSGVLPEVKGLWGRSGLYSSREKIKATQVILTDIDRNVD